MTASSEAQKRASMKYTKANTTRINLSLNNKNDADIISHLERQENKQGYIKRLIREDIERHPDL